MISDSMSESKFDFWAFYLFEQNSESVYSECCPSFRPPGSFQWDLFSPEAAEGTAGDGLHGPAADENDGILNMVIKETYYLICNLHCILINFLNLLFFLMIPGIFF